MNSVTQYQSDGPADDARPQDIELYAAMLTFIKQRLLHVDELLNKPPRNRVEIETCALQIRVVLEHIVLSTLVANRPGAQAIVAAFTKKKAGEVHGLIRRINPRYWPIPFELAKPEEGETIPWQMIEPNEPYLREEDWGNAYGYCSSLLHAVNPYEYLRKSASDKSTVDRHQEQLGKLKEYSRKIQRLLKRHQIYLSEMNYSFMCYVPEDTSVRPKIEIWKRVPG